MLIDETNDVTAYWHDDLVAFYLGCPFSFEVALQQSGLPVRYLEQECNVPMFRTSSYPLPTRRHLR